MVCVVKKHVSVSGCLALVLLAPLFPVSAVATPIGAFSGEIENWLLDQFDPLENAMRMTFEGVTVQLDAQPPPGFESYNVRLESLWIDIDTEVNLGAGIGFEYDILNSHIVAGMIVEDGMGGIVAFDLRLDKITVIGERSGFIDAIIGVDDIVLNQALSTSSLFDFSLYVLGGDFVSSIQITGGNTSLLYALQNTAFILDGDRTSGSFSASPNIPEPTSVAAVGAGLVALALRKRRKK